MLSLQAGFLSRIPDMFFFPDGKLQNLLLKRGNKERLGEKSVNSGLPGLLLYLIPIIGSQK